MKRKIKTKEGFLVIPKGGRKKAYGQNASENKGGSIGSSIGSIVGSGQSNQQGQGISGTTLTDQLSAIKAWDTSTKMLIAKQLNEMMDSILGIAPGKWKDQWDSPQTSPNPKEQDQSGTPKEQHGNQSDQKDQAKYQDSKEQDKQEDKEEQKQNQSQNQPQQLSPWANFINLYRKLHALAKVCGGLVEYDDKRLDIGIWNYSVNVQSGEIRKCFSGQFSWDNKLSQLASLHSICFFTEREVEAFIDVAKDTILEFEKARQEAHKSILEDVGENYLVIKEPKDDSQNVDNNPF